MSPATVVPNLARVSKTTMRAARIVAPGKVAVEDLAIPTPGNRQVRVRLQGCGLCGSNLPIWRGRPWFEYPIAPGAPGHEGWGIVDAVGRDVEGIAPSDRVAMLSYHAFAEYDVAEADHVLRLPASTDGLPLPGEPLGCAMNVFRRSDIRPGQMVAILGIGFLGALITQLAANAGARVIAISRRQFALDLAKRCGAETAIALDEHGRVLEAVKELTGGQLCDRVIEATGEQWPLDLAGELTQIRGRLMVAGYHQDARQVNMQLWNWRGLDVINAHERDPNVYMEGIRLAVNAVADGAIDPANLITHRFALEELDQAFHALDDRPDGFLKAWIAL